MQDEQGDLATLVEESTQGLRTIKSFGRRPEMTDRFAVRARQLHDTATGKGRLLARTSAEFDLVPNLTLAAVLIAGASAVAYDALTIGELVAFVTLQLMLIWPIESLGWIIANGQEAITAADRIQEVLDTAPTIVDRPGAVPLHRSAVRGRLRFEQVGFGYPGVAAPVLRDVTLEVQPGETVAIVGATGSGKTTLLSLVPRLYDVTAGRISLDGRDIRDVQLTGLRRVVGVAFEEPTLFSMSVWENLTLGRPDAAEDEVRAALAVAQADFVYELPWGLATRSVNRGSPSPAASGSGSPWPAPYSVSRGCWCSTIRSPRSTYTPRRWSRRRWSGCSGTRPRCWWCTARRPSPSPTGWRCSPTGGSRRSAPTPNCSPPFPTTGPSSPPPPENPTTPT